MQPQWVDRAMCFDEPPDTVVLVYSNPVCAIRDTYAFGVSRWTKRKAVLLRTALSLLQNFSVSVFAILVAVVFILRMVVFVVFILVILAGVIVIIAAAIAAAAATTC